MTVGAMISGWGATAVDLGICPDDGAALAARVRDAAGLDLLVTTGGASVGDYDLVQQALGREGLALDFWKIAMRPGKPLLFGTPRRRPGPGLPGQSGLLGRLRDRVPAHGAAENAVVAGAVAAASAAIGQWPRRQ